jgi:hypothetical protein
VRLAISGKSFTAGFGIGWKIRLTQGKRRCAIPLKEEDVEVLLLRQSRAERAEPRSSHSVGSKRRPDTSAQICADGRVGGVTKE